MNYLTGKQKAGILLKILGDETASIVLKQLPKDTARYLNSIIIKPPSYEDIVMILQELRSLPPAKQETKKAEKKEINNINDIARYYLDDLVKLLKNEREYIKKLVVLSLETDLQKPIAEKLLDRKTSIDDLVDLEISKDIISVIQQKVIQAFKS